MTRFLTDPCESRHYTRSPRAWRLLTSREQFAHRFASVRLTAPGSTAFTVRLQKVFVSGASGQACVFEPVSVVHGCMAPPVYIVIEFYTPSGSVGATGATVVPPRRLAGG